jgi:NitT/TauT family transport system ATP-binding protein
MIEFRNVSKIFRKQVDGHVQETRALDNVSFQIPDGAFVSIIGPSGCGKTTLLRILDGLTPCDGGEVLIDGKPVTGPGPDRGVVFQSYALLPWRDVLSNIEFGLELQGVPRAERRAVAERYVRVVGLAGFERHYPEELSGGMQQRTGLARALSVNPQILLMDEPFASVDAQTHLVLQRDLLRIWEQEGMTVLFITHAMDEAVFLSDRVVVMSPHPGQIVQILDIDLPRPRGEEFDARRLPRFMELTSQIWDLLRRGAEDAAEGIAR